MMAGYFTLNLHRGGSYSLHGEDADGWIETFDCGIRMWGMNRNADNPDDPGMEIGEASGWIVPFYAHDRRIDPLDLADSLDQDVYDLVAAVIDPETKDFYDSLNIQANGDILCMNQMLILPQFRGHGLGSYVKWELLDLLGRGCAVAVTKPHPINGSCHPKANLYGLQPLDDVPDDEVRIAQTKLAKHWGKLGFRPTFPGSEYHYFDLARISPEPEVPSLF